MCSSCVVRVFIYASVHCTIVTIILCHQVSFVLACPPRGTHVTTWYHHLRTTCCHVTYSTWNIVVVQTAWIYARLCFIFSSVDLGNSSTSYMFFIYWITCQAYIVRSTSLVTPMRSSDITCRIKKYVLILNDIYRHVLENLIYSEMKKGKTKVV